MRAGNGELDSIKHQLVSLETDQIVFGHGRHAWYVLSLSASDITFESDREIQPWTIPCCQ
jgi:hypothetical protein